MALEYWFPLTSDLHNQGIASLANASVQSGCSLSSDGKLGGCYKNTGTNACVRISAPLSADQFSLAAWVRIDTKTNGWNRAFGMSGSDSYMGMVTEHTNGTVVGFHYYKTINGSNTSVFDSYPCSPTAGVWYHYAMCYDGTKYYIYQNGSLVQSANASKTNIRAEMDYLYLFGYSGGYSKDSMNDVRIYSHCLSPLEVKEISKGLVLHYPMTGGGRSADNIVANSYVNTTSSSYGFGVRNFQITEGKTYTVSVRGYISDAAVSSGTHLAVYFYKSDWSYCPAILEIRSTAPETKFATFTATQTTTMTISSYSFKSQGKAGDSVTCIWYKVEEGNKPTPWVPNSADTSYTSMGYNNNIEYDVSGYLHNGTINGSVSYSSDTPRYSVSTHFNASNTNYITIPAITVDMKNITFAAWGKFDTTSNWMRIFDFGEKASGGGYGIIISNGASGYGGKGLTLVIVGSGGTSLLNQVVYTITTGVWFHVAVTILDSSVKVYVNGTLVKTYTVTALSTSTPYNLNYIGKSNWSDPYLTGNVSDFRLYATCLSATQVAELYHTSASIANNGTLLAYEFIEN